jgi:hypothetical protein
MKGLERDQIECGLAEGEENESPRISNRVGRPEGSIVYSNCTMLEFCAIDF